MKRISSGKSNSNDPSGSEGNVKRGRVYQICPNDSTDHYWNDKYVKTVKTEDAGKVTWDSHSGNDSIHKDTTKYNTNGRRK